MYCVPAGSGLLLGLGIQRPCRPDARGWAETAELAPLARLQRCLRRRVALPPPDVMLGLIRTTIIAINQANQTGNYTVLRDLGAPDFRNANDASRLAAIFQVLREQGIDFTPLLQIPPEVSETPSIDAQGLLHLVGFFPTEPLRVNFDMSFQAEKGRWRPYTISVYLARVEAQASGACLDTAGGEKTGGESEIETLSSRGSSAGPSMQHATVVAPFENSQPVQICFTQGSRE